MAGAGRIHTGHRRTALAVVDLEKTTVTVKLMAVSPSGLTPVAGSRAQAGPTGPTLILSPAAGSTLGTVPMVVEASGSVAVEVDAGPVGSPGVVVTPALALR